MKDAVSGGNPQDIESEIGDLLFSVVNLARKLNVDPEVALRGANDKFTRRFNAIEDKAEPDLQSLTLDEMEALWQTVKKDGL